MVGRFDVEGPEERLFDPDGVFETDGRDLAGGGMDPAMVVVVNFVFEDLLALANLGDVVAGTGANQMILDATLRAFNFSFGGSA